MQHPYYYNCKYYHSDLDKRRKVIEVLEGDGDNKLKGNGNVNGDNKAKDKKWK